MEHCASEPQPFLTELAGRSAPVGAPFLAMVFSCLLGLPAYSAVHEIESIGLTVNDLDREVRFYTQVLPFEKVSRANIKGPAADDLLGLRLVELRVARLKLGSEQITLTEHLAKGRPVPSDSRSYDHWSQHVAIVVRDMDKAYEHLRQHRVRCVSTSPQTLPGWNKAAAGIKAFYFRDPEDHVLEIIWFPPGKGDPKWHKESEKLFLGIDHTAIVVSDTEKSLEFYRDLLGMRVAGESENYGVEQEHLNQVFGARLRITGLRAEKGPGIEFLEYLTPPGGRDLPEDSKPNDVIFWHTDLEVDHLDNFASIFRGNRTQLISSGVIDLSGLTAGSVRCVMVRDPDGHALQLEQRAEIATSAQR